MFGLCQKIGQVKFYYYGAAPITLLAARFWQLLGGALWQLAAGHSVLR